MRVLGHLAVEGLSALVLGKGECDNGACGERGSKPWLLSSAVLSKDLLSQHRAQRCRLRMLDGKLFAIVKRHELAEGAGNP